LVSDLSENVSPHHWEYEFVGFLLLLKLHGMRVRGFSGERNSSKGVHNHVDPEKLSNTERRVSEGSTSDQDNSEADNVNNKLELDELSDVVKDVSSPLSSSED